MAHEEEETATEFETVAIYTYGMCFVVMSNSYPILYLSFSGGFLICVRTEVPGGVLRRLRRRGCQDGTALEILLVGGLGLSIAQGPATQWYKVDEVPRVELLRWVLEVFVLLLVLVLL